jgi:hypothetical protein
LLDIRIMDKLCTKTTKRPFFFQAGCALSSEHRPPFSLTQPAHVPAEGLYPAPAPLGSLCTPWASWRGEINDCRCTWRLVAACEYVGLNRFEACPLPGVHLPRRPRISMPVNLHRGFTCALTIWWQQHSVQRGTRPCLSSDSLVAGKHIFSGSCHVLKLPAHCRTGPKYANWYNPADANRGSQFRSPNGAAPMRRASAGHAHEWRQRLRGSQRPWLETDKRAL